MARSLNKVMIIGNLGRDAEMKYLESGKVVCNFSVAVNRSYNTADGEKRDETEWFRIEAWDKLAEICGEYLTKGMRVYVEGRLRTREYTDKDGVKRTAVEIIANDMMMLDSRDTAAERPTTKPTRSDSAPVEADDTDADEMPF